MTAMEAVRRRIIRHNHAQLEAAATRDELAAKLRAAAPPWPAKRWRVEGSFGGTSRLLTRKQGERAQARYGGRLVEVVPSWAQELARLKREAGR